MRKYLNIATILVIGFVVLGLTVLDSWNYTEYGVTLPFTGLNLKTAANNLAYGEATVCDNWVFDMVGALHARRGLNQWNATTFPDGITFLGDYSAPSGNSYYLVGSKDTSWLPLSYETDWTYYTIPGWNIDQGDVMCYTGSPFLHVGDTDSNYFWRALVGAGVDLVVKIGARDSEYRIVAVLEDTLIKLDSNLFNSTGDSTYVIQIQDFAIHDDVTCNGDYFVATNVGLIRYHGDSISFIDSLDYKSLTLTADYPVYDDYHGRLSWLPTIKRLGINHVLYVSMNPTLSDTATQADETRHLWYTMQYPVHIVSSSIKTWGAAMRPDSDSTTIVAVYEVATDSSTAIQFLVDSIRVESFDFGSGENTVYLNKFYPSDSTWDSTRFQTGDWVLRSPSCDTCGAIQMKTEFFSIPGMRWEADTDSAFYACDGPYSSTLADTITLEAVRRVKVEQEGASYLCLEVYKDRLWTVVADNPDELRYAPQFFPDSMVTGYQTIGIDLANGDGINTLHERHGMLYAYSKNTGHTLAGATVADFYLRKVLSTVGVAAPKAFVDCGQFVFLPHYTGFYLYDGGQLKKISDKIEPIIRDSINWAAAEDNMCAGYYDNHIWISYPSGTSEDNNRTLVYSVADGRWGNQSFVAGAYHAVTNPADTNQFLIGLVNEGAVCVYEGGTDRDTALQCEYQTGWQDFGTHHVKEIKDYFVTYNKSASCSLAIEFTRNDTLLYTDKLGTDATTQTFKDKYRNLEAVGSDIYGRYLKIGMNLESSGGEGWISRFTLGVSHKKQAVHGD